MRRWAEVLDEILSPLTVLNENVSVRFGLANFDEQNIVC